MQWNAIAPHEEGTPLQQDGWQWGEPLVGSLPFEQLATVCDVLARHTATPDDCVAALWVGWGWMRGRSAGSIAFATNATDPDEIAQLRDEALRPVPSSFSPDLWAAPRLALPGRDYLLFEVDIDEFGDPVWAAANGWDGSPNLLWPNDRVWFIASEIDFDTTIVGGSRALVDELIASERLEASRIPPDASLQWDADRINRPDSHRPG